MFKEMKNSIPLWLGITAYLTFGDYIFTFENMRRFGKQFLIVALVGALIVVLQNYVIDWVYERSGGKLKSVLFRMFLYSMINLFALYVVITGMVLYDTHRTFQNFVPVYMKSGLMIVGITVLTIAYYQFKFKYHLQKRQQDY